VRDIHPHFVDATVIDTRSVLLKQMFPRTLVKLKLPHFSVQKLRNPLIFSEFSDEPSFVQNEDGSATVIDIFDAENIDR
jgi:hypothetical protein